MSDLDQRIADGLREFVERAPVEADVWPATERYVAQHRRHRHAIAGAAIAVALVAGVLVAISLLGGAGSKAIVSHPGPTTAPQPGAPRAALTATGPVTGSFTITASPSGQLSFSPSAVRVTTGIYAVTLVDGSAGAHTLDFDDPATLWSQLLVNAHGETKTTRIFFGRPGIYTFYDSIPGHRAAGMEGTVTVTGISMTLAQAEAISQPTGTSLPLSAEEISQRNHPLHALPFPDMTGGEHHSGGPYIGARRAADDVLKGYRCTLGGPERGDPNTGCLQVDVRFFDHYADWWAVEGGQTQFVGSWGPDREMYVVTIFGKLEFVTTAVGRGPAYTPWRTFQIDATTGRVMMTGGLPLPEHFPGVETFRAPSRPAG